MIVYLLVTCIGFHGMECVYKSIHRYPDAQTCDTARLSYFDDADRITTAAFCAAITTTKTE